MLSKRPATTQLVPSPAKKKKDKIKNEKETKGGAAAALLRGPSALSDDAVFRPAAHLAAADVTIVSEDKKQRFELHAFMLKMRSPVFEAMLSSLDETEPDDGPIVLPDKGPTLKVFFEALYSNSPLALVKPTNVVDLCFLANKYSAKELESLCRAYAGRFLQKHAKLSGTFPSVPDLLLLGQRTQDASFLTTVLAGGGVASFCASTTPGVQHCVAHPIERIPCYYGTPACRAKQVLQPSAKAVLEKLNPKTLVAILESLVSTCAVPPTPAAPVPFY
jgi:hypothetical protein